MAFKRNRGRCGVLLAGVLFSGFLSLPAARAQTDGDAIATVNGRPINKRRMVDILMEGHGLAVLQQLVVLELAKEESQRLKLKVTQADIDAEFQRAVDNIAPRTRENGEPLDEPGRLQALDFLLQQKGLSMTEFKLGMERNAHLRKVIERNLKIDEPTLREEFARLYGEKVEVRIIQANDQGKLYEAIKQLDANVDFALIAQRVSQDAASAERGGLLDPFAFNDERVAAVLREAAFNLAAGEHTPPILNNGHWFILKLERRIAPQDVRFEDVRGEVERKLKERIVPDQMNKLVMELYQKAQVRVLDKDLKAKFEDLSKRNQITPGVTP